MEDAMVRDGLQYVAGLKDDRNVWLDGRSVDVTTDPVLSGSVKGMAGYFDWQLKHADDCLVENEAVGQLTNASLLIPRKPEDLAARSKAFDKLARYSFGMLGRTPDYVNVTLSGFAARHDVFDRDGKTTHGDRITAFHREVATKDLSLTHAIVNPNIDKSLNDISGVNGRLAVHVIRRTKDSVIVRGSKMLATLAPFADEMFVYPSSPLPVDTPPEYAIAFSIPMNTKGLIVLCRDHTGVDAPIQDRPFSSRFDEQDSVVFFDDVEIPLDRLFVDGDVEVYNAIPKSGWMSNILQQTCTRAAVKLEFAYDLCLEMARICNSDKRPEVQAMLGELRTYANLTRAAIRAGEIDAHDHGNGAFFLRQSHVRGIKNMMPSWMVRTNEIIVSIGSHNLLCTPTQADFANPAMAPLLEEMLVGAKDYDARYRAQIFRTAWDFAGSALGARVELYERFYLTSQVSNFKLEATLARFERKENLVVNMLRDFANC